MARENFVINVTDAGTGDPIPGIPIRATTVYNSQLAADTTVSNTDPSGNCTLSLLTNRTYRLRINDPDGTGYNSDYVFFFATTYSTAGAGNLGSYRLLVSWNRWVRVAIVVRDALNITKLVSGAYVLVSTQQIRGAPAREIYTYTTDVNGVAIQDTPPAHSPSRTMLHRGRLYSVSAQAAGYRLNSANFTPTHDGDVCTILITQSGGILS